MDFADIKAATKAEAIRAFSVEKALEHRGRQGYADVELINTALVIENFIKTGEATHEQLDRVYEEAETETRFAVKQAVEEQFSNIDLDDLYVSKGWITRPESEEKETS